MDALAGNLLIFSVQIALVIAVASIAALLPMPVAARLAFWRAVLAASLLVAVPGAIGISPAAPSAVIETTAAASQLVATPVAPAWTIAEVIALAWMTGLAIRLTWLGVGLVALGRLRGSCGELIDAGPRPVYLHPRVRQPVSFGVLRPLVLLPEDARALPHDARSAIIHHERLHIERHDWVWHVAEELVRAVFWFHPAVWWAIDRIRLAREQVVDAVAVDRTGNRRLYMETLLQVAERPQAIALVSAFGARRHLVSRMRCLASAAVPRPMRVPTRVALAALLLVGITAACALPWQQQVYSTQDAAIVLPSPITEVRPVYTPAAMQAGIQGTVVLTAVVRPDGRADDVEIVESLDSDLDEQARLALEQWRFEPGTRDGVAVPVQVTLEFTFTLR